MIKFEKKFSLKPFEISFSIKHIAVYIVKKERTYSLDGNKIEEHIFKPEEVYDVDFILTKLGKNNFQQLIEKGYFEKKRPKIVNILLKIWGFISKHIVKISGFVASIVTILTYFKY
jgi:hypothetical protein